MTFIRANGASFHVQRLDPTVPDPTAPDSTAGARGPVVVFVHGLVIDNLSSFFYTLAAPTVAMGASALLYDLRGHGRSDRSPHGYTTGDGVADLRGVLDALDIREPVYLVCNSYGGFIATRLAVAAPERVAGLVLIEAICAGPRAVTWIEDMLNTLSAGALSLEYDRTAELLRAIPGQRRLAKLATNAEGLLNETSLIEDLAAERLLEPAELAAISCPVLGVYGAQSELLPGADDLRRHVRDCQVEVVEGLAHTVLRDASGQLRDIVMKWLAERAGERFPQLADAAALAPAAPAAYGPPAEGGP
jgi:pimeloyl-ACP methyl ester carboxylesterase